MILALTAMLVALAEELARPPQDRSPLAWLLAPVDDVAVVPYMGRERLVGSGPGWAHLEGSFGAHRFVVLSDGLVVAGLQAVPVEGAFRVANIYVHPAARRHGVATAIFQLAQEELSGPLQHSSSRTPLGDRWIRSLSACQVIDVSEGSEHEDLGWEAEDLFRDAGIRIAPYEEPLLACVRGDEVLGVAVGGLTAPYEDSMEFRFSVVVAPSAQRQGVARKLVREVVEHARGQRAEWEEAHGLPVEIVAWVVNPHMAELLESEGFEADGEWSQDSPMMRIYG